jgi:hypothetical protein
VSHSKLRARLNDYVDRELPGTQRAELSAHLAECQDCAAELRELEYTVGLLRRLPEEELPPGFADAVMERVRAGESEPGWLRTLRGLLQPTLTIGATAAIAGLAVFAVVREAPTGTVASAPTQTAHAERPLPPPTSSVDFTRSPVQRRAPFEVARRDVARPQGHIPQTRRHRRALDLALLGQPDQVARTLRGAGHPHSNTLAAHFEELSDADSIQLIVASPAPQPRRSARR